MRGRGAALEVLLLLAACAAAPPAIGPAPEPGPSVPAGSADTCGATPLAGLIGQPATALERVLVMRQVRILRPDDPFTEEFSAARLNIFIDRSERIARLTCG